MKSQDDLTPDLDKSGNIIAKEEPVPVPQRRKEEVAPIKKEDVNLLWPRLKTE
jgi:hypothetical protein